MQKKSNILIVDDSEEMIWVLANVLEKAGLSVDAVTNGKDAIEYLQCNTEIRVVILDYQLPDMSGLLVLDHIKPKGAYFEVIVITGHGTDEIRSKCYDGGACAFMEKPFDINHLVLMCKQALKEKEGINDQAKEILHPVPFLFKSNIEGR